MSDPNAKRRTLTNRQQQLVYLLVEANRLLTSALFPGRIDQIAVTAESRMLRLCIRYDDCEATDSHFHTWTATQLASPETVATAALNHFLLMRNAYTATDAFGEHIYDGAPEGTEFDPISQVASARLPETEGLCPVYLEEVEEEEIAHQRPKVGLH